MIVLPFLLVALLGLANQYGSTCAVSAADEVVRQGTYRRLAGFALAAALSLAVMAAAGGAPRSGAIIGPGAVLGGLVAALGAGLNGRCAMGTIASLGRGRLDRLATLAGFGAGAWAVLHSLGLAAGRTGMVAPLQSPWLALAALAFAVLAWRRAQGGGLPSPGWMALIGLLNAVLLVQMVSWSWTGGLVQVAGGGMLNAWLYWTFLACLLAGSLIGGIAAGKFALRLPPLRNWLRSAAGGALLGMGAAMVPGSNDAMLLVGIPLLVPGLLLAYLCFWIALLALRWSGLTLFGIEGNAA